MKAFLHHTKLPVSDIDASTQWYMSLFGLEEIARYPIDSGVIVHLKAPNESILELWHSSIEDFVVSDCIHICFRVPSIYSFIKANENQIGWMSEIKVTPEEELFFVRDPDGWLIEVNHCRGRHG